ncbi:hypothetical protein HMN09_00122500 [Mycena chlorophos]|uniref:Cytochrome P450 n=1 Tax=Mycena chlorophos TaxID=658473 RepID=A0A8H6WN66_MYCCL|nr:hypothetical protein HMN09_00122500 [Mycena chlorophos]
MSSETFLLLGILLFAAITVIALLSYYFPIHPLTHKHIRHRTTISGIRDVLERPRDSQLQTRATANQALEHAFGLEPDISSFVSGDRETNAAFRRQASRLISNSTFVQLADIARQAVDITLANYVGDIPYAELIQVATFRFVVCGLLVPGTTPDELGHTHVREATRLITAIWLLSKQSSANTTYLRNQLKDHLDALFPADPSIIQLESLNPIWETFWRVVAPLFAQLRLGGSRLEDTRNAFEDFLELPTTAQFHALRCNNTAPSAKYASLEALRAWSPVSRIKRQQTTTHDSRLTRWFWLPAWLARRITSVETTVDVADIEAAHRSEYWAVPLPPTSSSTGPGPATVGVVPPDPNVYDPSRFLLEPQRAADVLAFGHGPLKCIAAKWAPLAIGLVVGALLDRINDVEYRLVPASGAGTNSPGGGASRDPKGWEGQRVVRL